MEETINQRIKRYRNKLDYNQQDVAEKMGMKLSTYSQMERGGKVSCERITKLAEILNVDVLTLLYGENESKTNNIKPIEPKPEPQPEKPTLPPRKPILPPKITPDDLTAREADLVIMFRNINKPNQTLVYEFVYNFFHQRDFKKVIKTMNPESF